LGVTLDTLRLMVPSRLVITSDQSAASRSSGRLTRRRPFEDVSAGEPVGWRTAFEVDADCEGVPLYLLWITDLDSLAHANEARAG
jgi:hypothetical protein